MVRITLTLPENIYQHATHLAAATHLDIASLVTEALTITLPAFDEAMTRLAPTVARHGGEEVQVVTDSQTASTTRALLNIDARWRDLLSQPHEGEMTTEAIAALLSLVLMQRRGWLMQSEVSAGNAERESVSD